MSVRWFGAAMIIGACSIVGFMISAAYKKEEREMRQLIRALEYMCCELQFHRSVLPDLCNAVGKEQDGYIGNFFKRLAIELESHNAPDVQACLASAAAATGPLSRNLENAICYLGSSLGRFDLEGQLAGLKSVKAYCEEQLQIMSQGRDMRLRSYQTLGVCTGAALAILFV